VDTRVAIRAHFERFPASIKGAFVLRAADGDPHQLRFEVARVAEWSGGVSLTLELDAVVLDVAPNLDLFVPFEFPTTDLPPGWYQLECEVLVDGTPSTVHPGDRFPMPWSRSAVRRGTVAIGAHAGEVRLGDLECLGDSVRIAYEAPHAPRARLSVDGTTLPLLEVTHDEGSGTGRIVGYPALRTHERLSIELKGADPIEVALP